MSPIDWLLGFLASYCASWVKDKVDSGTAGKIFNKVLFPFLSYCRMKGLKRILGGSAIIGKANPEDYLKLLTIFAPSTSESLQMTCVVPPTWFEEENYRERVLEAYAKISCGIKERIVMLSLEEIKKLNEKIIKEKAKKISPNAIKRFEGKNPKFTIYWARRDYLEKHFESNKKQILLLD